MTFPTPPPTVHSFSNPHWRGQIHATYAGHLDLILQIIDRADSTSILKTGSGRKVWVAESPWGSLCIKEIASTGLRGLFRRVFQGDPGAREWSNQVSLASAGAPVPAPILWAASRTTAGRRGVIVSFFLEGAVPVSDYVDGRVPLREGEKRELLEAAGRALGQLHQAGCIHQDPHGGNMLVLRSLSPVQIFFTDLKDIQLKKSLTWRERILNISEFLGGLAPRLSLTVKQRGLKAYLDVVRDWQPAFRNESEARRSMARAIEYYAARDFRARWRSRLAKCQEHGKRFHRLRTGAYQGWIRATWDSPSFRALLADPNGLFQSEKAIVVKDTPTTSVACYQNPELPGPIFMKRYNRKSAWERFKNLFRRSRAVRVWRSAFALETLGIPTPEAVCVLEKRYGPLLLESFVFTRWVPGGIGLDDFYNEQYGHSLLSACKRQDKKILENAVARIFRDLHSNRISHGDLKGRNILLDPSKSAPFAPCFVDLDAMCLHPIRFRRSRINDLSRLLFSLFPTAGVKDQIRFFKVYAFREPCLWKQRKKWWQAIRKRTSRKLREKGYSFPPLTHSR
ncbi:MAG: hypothetical protein DIKNOCCD_03330 [bacterium]|nr:hypothetical protein [bacterium]